MQSFLGCDSENLESIGNYFSGIKLSVSETSVVANVHDLAYFTSLDRGFQIRLMSCLSILQAMVLDGQIIRDSQIDQAVSRAADIQNTSLEGVAEKTPSGYPIVYTDLFPPELNKSPSFERRVLLGSSMDPDYAPCEVLTYTDAGRGYRHLFLGDNRSYLRTIQEKHAGVLILANNNKVVLRGDPEQTAAAREMLVRFVHTVADVGLRRRQTDKAMDFVLGSVGSDELERIRTTTGKGKKMAKAGKGENVEMVDMVNLHINEMNPVTPNQRHYYDALLNPAQGVVITQGPAGTGKTSLFLQAAMLMLRRHYRGEEGYNQNKLILSFPLVSVGGGNLGALPGDKIKKTYDKFATYYNHMERILAPLNDRGIPDITRGKKILESLMENGIVEIQLLEDLRGKSYPDALMALDEAQNTTSEQMLTYVTRPETTTRMFIMGDLEQADRKAKKGDVSSNFELPSCVRIDAEGGVWLTKGSHDLRIGFHEDVGRFVASNTRSQRLRTVDSFSPANGLAELFLAYSQSPFATCCVLESVDCQRSGFAKDVMDLRAALRTLTANGKRQVPVGRGTADSQRILQEAASKKTVALGGEGASLTQRNVVPLTLHR